MVAGRAERGPERRPGRSKPGARPRGPKPRLLEEVPIESPQGALAVLLLVGMGLFVLVLSTLQLLSWLRSGPAYRPTSDLDAASLWVSLGGEVVFFLAFPLAYLRLVRPHGNFLDLLRLRLTSRSFLHVLLGLAAALAGVGLSLVVHEALAHYANLQEDATGVTQSLQSVLRSNSEFVLLLPLLAGVAEEVFFRGFLQPCVGLLVSNALFAFVHIGYSTVGQVLTVFFFGFLLGMLFHSTRSLWAPILAHVGYDLVRALNLLQAPIVVGAAA